MDCSETDFSAQSRLLADSPITDIALDKLLEPIESVGGFRILDETRTSNVNSAVAPTLGGTVGTTVGTTVGSTVAITVGPAVNAITTAVRAASATADTERIEQRS